MAILKQNKRTWVGNGVGVEDGGGVRTPSAKSRKAWIKKTLPKPSANYRMS